MEVHRLRYKERYDNCQKDWKNFDNIVLQNHFDVAGCKSPYFDDEMYNGTSCRNQSASMKATFSFERVRNILPPCNSIESIGYIVEQRNITKNLNWNGKTYKDYFRIGFAMRNSRFKLITSKKEVDFQCLIGYVGGYIGMFTGFALSQIPDVLITVFGYVKQLLQR